MMQVYSFHGKYETLSSSRKLLAKLFRLLSKTACKNQDTQQQALMCKKQAAGFQV